MDKKTFFSNELTVFSALGKIHLDFKCIFPMKEQNEVTTNTEHNVVIVDPQQAKDIARMLKQIINDYEKRWGKIPQIKLKKTKKSGKEEKPSYVG